MKKIILFDIDYTLFDTAQFKESGLTIYKLYDEVEEALKTLSSIAEIGIFSQGEDAFQREKLRQTLIHEHFKEENIHIFASKDENLGSVLDKYKDREIFLVDDKLEVLKLGKDLSENVYAIWLKRGPFADVQKDIVGFTPDATIINLSEAVAFVNKGEQ
jgi:FMN phosphatase YigB (HAD superfamily)